MISIDTATVLVIVRTLLDRSVTDIIAVLVLLLFRIDVTYPNQETKVVHDMERIPSSLEIYRSETIMILFDNLQGKKKPSARRNDTIR